MECEATRIGRALRHGGDSVAKRKYAFAQGLTRFRSAPGAAIVALERELDTYCRSRRRRNAGRRPGVAGVERRLPAGRWYPLVGARRAAAVGAGGGHADGVVGSPPQAMEVEGDVLR